MATAARSFLRSSAARSAASRLAGKSPTNAFSHSHSSFQLPKHKPLSAPRVFRAPVELSCSVESLMPYHTATASALLTSMLSVAPRRHGWTPEGKDQTR